MAQTYTENPYNSAHVVATDMTEINQNFAALKSAFSGATTPANTVAGQWWYDTTSHILKVRNEANSAWLSVWNLASNKPVITNLSAEITGAMIAAAIKDAAAGTASLRTLGTGAAQACAGNDARLSDDRTPPDLGVSEGKLAASAVAQAKLKTSTGSVNVNIQIGGSPVTSLATLPGGEYGFYPKSALTDPLSRVTEAEVKILYQSGSGALAAASYCYLSLTGQTDGTGPQLTLTQRYVTASGEVHWIFILRDKTTKDILGMYQAPDHPCMGNGGKPLVMPHPFGNYDTAKHEIIVINPSDEDVFNMQDACIMPEDKPDRDILEVIIEDYEIDEGLKTPWTRKEVTVGLPKNIDWKRVPEGSQVVPVKKRIPKPDYITTRKLWRRK